MSIPQNPKPVKLVISVFMNDKSLLQPVAAELSKAFGPVDIASPWLAFNFTDYYAPEMGAPLHRRILVYKNLIQQYGLADVKFITNDIERKFEKNGNRRANIDPGYLGHERFVLATAKNFTHRICIGTGIYADLTLIYTQGGFQPLPWTYPDYAEENMRRYLGRIRDKYIWDIDPERLHGASPVAAGTT